MATYTVTHIDVSGPGSLRDAIIASNDSVGVYDTIEFNIPGDGVHTFNHLLPAITDPVTIDGYSQPGAAPNTLPIGDNAALRIEIVASLLLKTNDSTIRGLVINRSAGHGIRVQGQSNWIAGNFIGTDPTGTHYLPPTEHGVYLLGDGNRIGGTSPADRNVISHGSLSDSIHISFSSNNVVEGNYLGTNAAGTAALANVAGRGVHITTHDANAFPHDGPADGNRIGGATPGAGNLISGNGFQGIYVSGFAHVGHPKTVASNTIIQGNFIGTNAEGTAAVPNHFGGISLGVNGAAAGSLIGGTTSAARNIISGNGVHGAGIQIGNGEIETTDNTVQGNYIGTDVTGSYAIPNGQFGIELKSPGNFILGNRISGNQNTGVHVRNVDSGLIQGNFIGTNAAGTAAIPNSTREGDGGVTLSIARNVTVQGNVISGNARGSVTFENSGSNNLLGGNLIGVAVDSTSPLGNGSGVYVNYFAEAEPSHDRIGSNVIAYNAGEGVAVVNGAGLTIEANTIFGNGGDGVLIGGSNVHQPKEHRITRNSIYDNSRLGINLYNSFDPPSGLTANDTGDADEGIRGNEGNRLQNYPVLTSATSGGFTNVAGTLNGTPNTTFTIEFFANPLIDPSHHGEGQTYLGSTSVTTDASGNASFTEALLLAVPVGSFITATATDPAGNTSEFSENETVVAADPPPASSVGLVSWWRAENNALDSAGNNHGSPLNGASYAAGRVGQAFNFDGVNDYVHVFDDPSLEFTSQLTIAAWIRPDDVSGYRDILTKWGGVAAYELIVGPGGVLQGYLSNNGTNYDSLFSPAGALNAGAWAHVATTFSAGQWKLYINGVEVAAKTSSITSIFAAGNDNVAIGRSSGGGGAEYFRGLIDEVGLYNRGLSPDQIQTVYQSGHGALGNQPPVLALIGNQSVNEGELLSFTASATDPNAPPQTLTFSLDVGAPAGASIDPVTGLFSWTPTEAHGPGSYQMTLRITDSGTPALNDFETITIAVNEVNAAPALAAIGDKIVNEGELLSFTATATDTDVPSQTLTFNLDAGAPTGAAIDPATGAFTWTPTMAQAPGNYAVTVRVTDNGTPALDDFETISIVVNAVDRGPFAILDIDANGVARYMASAGVEGNLTLSLVDGVYSFQETGQRIAVTGTGSAGWSGSRTNAISGPQISINSIVVDTGDLNDLIRLVSAAHAIMINGGLGSDTLVSPDVATTWTIDDSNAGGLIGGVRFESVENLTGGSADDTFVFQSAGAVSGTIDGQSGNDTLDYLARSMPVTVNLQSHTATATGGFTNIEGLFGSRFSDTLIGPDRANSWLLPVPDLHLGGLESSVPNNGVLRDDFGRETFQFWSVENLTGGDAADSFRFGTTVLFDADRRPFVRGGSVSGIIDGGAGQDWLAYGDYPFGVTINLQSHTATATGGFTNIEGLFGSRFSDTLIGPDATTTWTIDNINEGSLTGGIGFESIENLTGGVLDDTFQFSDGVGLSGRIDGQAGIDTLDYSVHLSGITVDLSTGVAASVDGGVTKIENVFGGAANDLLFGDAGDNTLRGNGGYDILLGGAGLDHLFGDDGRDMLFGGIDADSLAGGADDDILISGTTIYDANTTVLLALQHVWTRTDASYFLRVARLRSGKSGYALSNVTVLTDDALDSLFGGTGQDWFWSEASDNILDKESAEIASTVPPRGRPL